jgi:hypothetical protein
MIGAKFVNYSGHVAATTVFIFKDRRAFDDFVALNIHDKSCWHVDATEDEVDRGTPGAVYDNFSRAWIIQTPCVREFPDGTPYDEILNALFDDEDEGILY